jgi:stage V sporulation protein G
MEISEVRIKLINNDYDRLKAFCSITWDDEFVIRDIKIIAGDGGFFVAMPSRKISDHCDKCRSKNHLQAKYCNNCGAHLPDKRAKRDAQGRIKLYADIAHPVNARCRNNLQKQILRAFIKERTLSKQPGYTPSDFDGDYAETM